MNKSSQPRKGKSMKKPMKRKPAGMQTLAKTLEAGGPPQSLGQAFGP